MSGHSKSTCAPPYFQAQTATDEERRTSCFDFGGGGVGVQARNKSKVVVSSGREQEAQQASSQRKGSHKPRPYFSPLDVVCFHKRTCCSERQAVPCKRREGTQERALVRHLKERQERLRSIGS